MIDQGSDDPQQHQATCVWSITDALVLALDAVFGEPHDAYVNGSQVWLREDGPGGITIEWRLHPVASYRAPASLTTYQVFPTTALAIAEGNLPPVPASALWDGVEAFIAYDSDQPGVTPDQLASLLTDVLGVAPDAVGWVAHEPIAMAWQASERSISIIDAVLEQLRTSQPGSHDHDGGTR